MMTDWDVEWKGYKLRGSGKIKDYKGAMMDGNVLHNPISSQYLKVMVDMVLFMDSEDLRQFTVDLSDSDLSAELFMDEIAQLDAHKTKVTASDLVFELWESTDQHWSKLLEEEMPHSEFVEDYLFRFIEQIGASDFQMYIKDSEGKQYAISDLRDIYHKYELISSGKGFDEYIYEQGFPDTVNSFFVESRRGDTMTHDDAKEICQGVVEEVILAAQRHHVDRGYNSWGKVVNLANDLAKGIIFDDWYLRQGIQPEERPASLGEYVFEIMGKYVADLATDFLDEDLRKRSD